MKRKIMLLLTYLLSCSFLMAQNNQINDIVRVDFPARTVKLSKDQLKVILNEMKKSSSKLYIPSDTNRQYYSIDSNLITLNSFHWNAKENYLEKTQKNLEALYSTPDTKCDCTYKMKKINKNRVLISNLDSGDWGTYSFYSVNRKNNAIFNGSLQYFKSNSSKAKALKTLNELLKNIAYKF